MEAVIMSRDKIIYVNEVQNDSIRDLMLIKERLIYEDNFFSNSPALEDYQDIDQQIDSMQKGRMKVHFADYGDDNECWSDEMDMDGAYIDGDYQGYVLDNDPFDSIDENHYDY